LTTTFMCLEKESLFDMLRDNLTSMARRLRSSRTMGHCLNCTPLITIAAVPCVQSRTNIISEIRDLRQSR